MAAIKGVSLTSDHLLGLVTILLVCSVLLGAVLLGRVGAHGRSPSGRPGRWAAAAGAVILPTLAVLAVGGLIINRAGNYLGTVGDLAGALSARSASSGTVLPLPSAEQLDAVPAQSWKASFAPAADGSREATWTGPVSGVTLPVKVIVPAGYAPDDGRTYAVIESLHGYVGNPDSMIESLQSPQALKAAIDAGRIPPTILVVPSLNVDDAPHDCADLQGRPAVGTWIAREIPRMIRASFPNVASDREGWMIMGLSAGAYCAGWAAIDIPGQFGAVGLLSSYNRPIEGGLATSGRRIADDYTLSTFLAAHEPAGIRFYVMGAQDDPLGSAQTAWRLADTARAPDTVTADTPETGGHAWPLWVERFPTLLQWWGQDPRLWSAVGLSAPSSPHADDGIAPVVDTPAAQRASAVDSVRPTSPAGLPARILAGLIALAGAAALLRWGPRLAVAPAGGGSGSGGRASARKDADRDKDGTKGTGAVGEEHEDRSAVRFGLFAARCAAVLVAAVLLASAAGLIINAAGGFYTTWHDLAEALV